LVGFGITSQDKHGHIHILDTHICPDAAPAVKLFT